MRLGFLLTRYTKFFEELIRELASYDEVLDIVVVYWSNDHLPIKVDEALSKVSFIPRSKYVYQKELFWNMNAVYVPGWMDRGYLFSVIRAKLNGCALVTCVGFDDQWHGTVKQIIGSSIYKLFLRRFLKYAWVAGPPQYMYARKFGYKNYDIVYNLLSANFEQPSDLRSRSKMPTLIYVGRFVEVKNLDAFLRVYSEKYSDKFVFRIIGTGVLEHELKLKYSKGIEWMGYKEPSGVRSELIKADFFVLPSISEQWSVAVHEAVQCGLALITSKMVGANSMFSIEGFNSYQFDPKDNLEIDSCLDKIAKLQNCEILRMKKASLQLAGRINTQMSARSFLSMIYKK